MSYSPSSGVGKLRITVLVVPDRQRLFRLSVKVRGQGEYVILRATVVIRSRVLDLLQTVVSDQTNIMIT